MNGNERVYTYHTGDRVIGFTKSNAETNGFRVIGSRQNQLFYNLYTHKYYKAKKNGSLHLNRHALNTRSNTFKLPYQPSLLPLRNIARFRLHENGNPYTDVTVIIQSNEGTHLTVQQIQNVLGSIGSADVGSQAAMKLDEVLIPEISTLNVPESIPDDVPTKLLNKMMKRTAAEKRRKLKHTYPLFQKVCGVFVCPGCTQTDTRLRGIIKHYKSSHLETPRKTTELDAEAMASIIKNDHGYASNQVDAGVANGTKQTPLDYLLSIEKDLEQIRNDAARETNSSNKNVVKAGSNLLFESDRSPKVYEFPRVQKIKSFERDFIRSKPYYERTNNHLFGIPSRRDMQLEKFEKRKKSQKQFESFLNSFDYYDFNIKPPNSVLDKITESDEITNPESYSTISNFINN